MADTIHPLVALTHFDGRNRTKISSLSSYFSELAWMDNRIRVMGAYLQILVKEKIVPGNVQMLERLTNSRLSIADGERIWALEKKTNHDLRALELFLKEKLKSLGQEELSPYVNFGVGSEDISNVALRLQIKNSFNNSILPQLLQLLHALTKFIRPVTNVPMLARTHGQVASVTTMGKELGLFLNRLVDELEILTSCTFHPKFSGEVGNFNTLSLVAPHNWRDLEMKFLKGLGFDDPAYATQIAPYDDLIYFFDSLKRLNSILTGFAKDIWLYAGLRYLQLLQPSGEAGSAGMPHKINPQYFEGAEGGLELANSLLEFFSRKFSYNRLQRDFSDSTVRRNIVLGFAYSLLSYQSLQTGLQRLAVNTEFMIQELDEHWEVLSEVLQTMLKMKGKDDAYIIIQKNLKGKKLTRETYQELISELPYNNEDSKKIGQLNPQMLVGDSEEVARQCIQKAERFIKKMQKNV